MLPKAKLPTVVQCTENIAVLNILHSVPCKPSSNAVTAIQSREAGYPISFEDERRLTSALTFLAYREDDLAHILAVCIHTTRKKKGLKVLLAVNRIESSEGWKQYASHVKQGFDRIAAILKCADGKVSARDYGYMKSNDI